MDQIEEQEIGVNDGASINSNQILSQSAVSDNMFDFGGPADFNEDKWKF